MKLKVVNNQRQSRPNVAALKELTCFFLTRACGAQSGTEWGTITVCLTDDRGMRDANRRQFGIDDTTDVISVPYEPLPGEAGARDADVMVNVECALRIGDRRDGSGQAAKAAWTRNHELAFYLAHGVDHLSGSDDATPAERKRMHRREKEWILDAEECGLVAALLQPDARKG